LARAFSTIGPLGGAMVSHELTAFPWGHSGRWVPPSFRACWSSRERSGRPEPFRANRLATRKTDGESDSGSPLGSW
jgi:hypothetical protein